MGEVRSAPAHRASVERARVHRDPARGVDSQRSQRTNAGFPASAGPATNRRTPHLVPEVAAAAGAHSGPTLRRIRARDAVSLPKGIRYGSERRLALSTARP